MRIFISFLILLLGYLPPASAYGDVCLSTSSQSVSVSAAATPLLPIEPSQPKQQFEIGIGALLLLIGAGLLLGLVLFPIGLSIGLAWLWKLALWVEIPTFLLLLGLVIAMYASTNDSPSDKLGAMLSGIVLISTLFIYTLLKGIELLILGLALGFLWLWVAGLALIVLSIAVPILIIGVSS